MSKLEVVEVKCDFKEIPLDEYLKQLRKRDQSLIKEILSINIEEIEFSEQIIEEIPREIVTINKKYQITKINLPHGIQLNYIKLKFGNKTFKIYSDTVIDYKYDSFFFF